MTVIGLCSWFIVVAFLFSSWLVGNKYRGGWIVTAAAGGWAVVYDAATCQWAFLIGAVIGIGISLRNYVNWQPTQNS